MMARELTHVTTKNVDAFDRRWTIRAGALCWTFDAADGVLKLPDCSNIVDAIQMQKGLGLISETGEWWYLRVLNLEPEAWRLSRLEPKE